MGDATERTAAAMEDLVRETSGMAEVTGRSRREAMREAQGAVQRTDVSTYLRQVRAREGDTAADTEIRYSHSISVKKWDKNSPTILLKHM